LLSVSALLNVRFWRKAVTQPSIGTCVLFLAREVGEGTPSLEQPHSPINVGPTPFSFLQFWQTSFPEENQGNRQRDNLESLASNDPRK